MATIFPREEKAEALFGEILKNPEACHRLIDTCLLYTSLISATKRPLPFKNGGGLLRPADLPLVKRIGKRLNYSVIVYFGMCM